MGRSREGALSMHTTAQKAPKENGKADWAVVDYHYVVTQAGLQHIFDNQRVLHDKIAGLDAHTITANANQTVGVANAAAQQAGDFAKAASDSAQQAASAAEITVAAKPLLEEIKQLRADVAEMRKEMKEQGCCVVM